jgi:hypothetical protein
VTLQTPGYHFALVVPDLPAACDEMSRALGLSWARVQSRRVQTETPDGPVAIDVTFVYSLEGPPYLELLEQRPGTIFGAVGLHHMGVWSDDPKAESARLDACGCPWVSVSVNEAGEWTSGLFHELQCGLRIEVVDIGASGPKLAHYLAGGDYAAPPP